ncbi:hypothetical protein SAMN05216249_10636 [Acetitomaculum ruminis DSM 5522]|uniref:Uncharacterized protein n=1 Tax=Acetitomaculum ruminis DSM 5522 TaxID=1120918 RepID=A0A1I0XCG3_9FIRM|nr:hypothetical protein [Acetitomaculum ruminis]SFA97613.1 hypothetical protein SAMN05216249_10636 [Acetitomaculum ruminis DSM 5522]
MNDNSLVELKKAEQLIASARKNMSFGDIIQAYSDLADALYIRRQHYSEDDYPVKEIIYLLEQCTFM